MTSKFGRRTRQSMLAAVILLLPLLAACSQYPGRTSNSASIDAPPASEEQAMLNAVDGTADGVNAANAQDQTGKVAAVSGPKLQQTGATLQGDSVTVYLLDRQGLVAPMTLSKPDTSAASTNKDDASASLAAAQTALTWMTADPKRDDQLPAGFTPLLPEGTKTSVKEDAKAGIMTVDFTDALPAVPAKQERQMIESIVWTMTELSGVNEVRITVAGQPLRTLPVTNIPLDLKLTRGMGINLEEAQGVQESRSMAVTLYFSAKTENGEGYFVPVTRIINRQQDRAQAALQELIKGPQDMKKLYPVLASDIVVDKLSQDNDETLNVSLKEADWTPQSTVSAEMMNALILTMTETTGAPQVKVAMNGDSSFLDSDSNAYDKPVTRPIDINAVKE